MTADPIRPPEAAGAEHGPRVLIAASNTSEHVFPALALARALKELAPAASVRFVGTSRGIENQAVPAAGFPLDLLPILPLSRRLSMETVLSPLAAVAGTAAALRLLRRHHIEAFGGSQGARHVNQALVAAKPYWPHPERIQILHACGRRDEADVRQAWRAAAPEARGLQVRVAPFIERLDLASAAWDLAITRAGAVTVAELTATGVPAILVPLPHAA